MLNDRADDEFMALDNPNSSADTFELIGGPPVDVF